MDGRSKLTTVSVKDIEKLHKALDRKLARLRAMLDEIEAAGKTKVKTQYWNSGVEADKKLEVFVRGVPDSQMVFAHSRMQPLAKLFVLVAVANEARVEINRLAEQRRQV